VVDRVATPRAEAIEHFAADLRALRALVGSPSFRTMSGRSHAISHTTLHEAAQGHRLPSWATTAEFVKACDADPADFRERWEQANQAVRAAAIVSDAVGADPTATDTTATDTTASDVLDVAPANASGFVATDGGEEAAVEPDTAAGATSAARSLPPSPVRPPRRWFRPVIVGTVLAGVLAAGAIVTGVMASRGDSPGAGTPGAVSHSRSAAPLLTAADCPVQQSNPPAASPPDKGDAGVFISDITLPDCTHVAPGTTVTKIWRFKNVGTVPWRGYALHRIDLPQQRDQCQTITDVPVKDTEPGQIVDIQVTVTTPDNAGFCFVRFKMEDASGRIAFPGNRPVNFQLIVD